MNKSQRSDKFVDLLHIYFEMSAVPVTGTVASFHSVAPVCLHCKTKFVISVPPLIGRVLSERRAEAGPGEIVT